MRKLVKDEIKRGHFKIKKKNKRLQGENLNKKLIPKFSRLFSSMIIVGIFIATIIAIAVMNFGSLSESFYSKHIMPKTRAEEVKRDYKSMAVIETSSMRILSSYNETKKLPMASTTKIMTALLTLENFADIETEFEVPVEAVGIEGTSIYLKKGEVLTIEEYLYGLMLPSANDCAVALSIIVAGSEEKFAELMNSKARELGLTSTNFVTASGLHDKEHYTTSVDLAKLTAYAMKNDKFREIVGTKTIAIKGSEEEEKRYLKNKQKLMDDDELNELGIKVSGVKSGFTPEAGRCLVTSAVCRDMEVIVVVLNAPNMFDNTKDILKEIFNDYSLEEIITPKKHITTLNVLNGQENKVNIYTREGFRYPLTKEEKAVIKTLYSYPESINAPVDKDQQVGEVKIVLFNEVVNSIPILSIESVEEEDFYSTFEKLIKCFIR